MSVDVWLTRTPIVARVEVKQLCISDRINLSMNIGDASEIDIGHEETLA